MSYANKLPLAGDASLQLVSESRREPGGAVRAWFDGTMWYPALQATENELRRMAAGSLKAFTVVYVETEATVVPGFLEPR